MSEHVLKIRREYFEAVISLKKKFEIRKNDRDYKVGDTLVLNEIDEEGKPTGKTAIAKVTYILDTPEFCKEGYVTMSISLAYYY